MPESYRETDDRSRLRRLDDEIQTLKRKECSAEELSRLERLEGQIRTLRIEHLKNDIALVQQGRAEMKSVKHAEDGVIQYLVTQTEPVDEDRIDAAVKSRRAILLKALHSLVDEGKVERTGAGKKASPYLYWVPRRPNGDEPSVNASTEPAETSTEETPEPHLRWKA